MATYNNSIMTADGLILLSDILAGGGELEFISLVTGSGIYTSEEKKTSFIRTMKNLKEKRQTTSFSAIAKMDNNQVLLKANVANDELSNGYSMTEIGVLARKKGTDDSILYCVVTAEESDYFPSASQGQYNIVFTIKTKIDDVENVSIVFSQEAYALAEELAVTNNSIQELEKRISSTEAIAKGKNRAKVFSTTESMNAWLSDSTNAGVANVGDNLYIIDTGVPDWWISEVLTEPDEAGRYYKIAQLETQKVDLTTYEARIQKNANDISTLNNDLANHKHSISDVSNLQSTLNDLSNRGNYTELGRYHSSVGNEAGIISANLSAYRYLIFNFIYANEILDSKILPRKLFTDYCSTAGLYLVFGNHQAKILHDGGIYAFVNSAYYVVVVYGIK